MKINQTTSILFWLAKSRKTKDGCVPIYCRITIDGEREEFSTGRKVLPSNWRSEKVIGNNDDAITTNKELNKIRVKLQQKFDQLEAVHERVTAPMLKNAYLDISPLNKTIIEAFTEYNAILYQRVNAQQATLKKKTWQLFQSTKEKVIAYLKHDYNTTDKFLKDISNAIGEEMLHYLTTTDNLGKNTAMKYIKNVKQIIDWAERKGYIKSDPLDGFKCTYKQPKRIRLAWNELMSLYYHPLRVQRLEEVRDVYVFSCFTGYAYMDTYELEPGNVMMGIDGFKWLIRDRYKGDHTKSNVPLLDIPIEIIEKYKSHPYCLIHNKLLPVNSNQRYNAYLKEIADIVGIKKELTTHTARHTFATTILMDNDCPIESIKDMLGHEDIRTTQIYAKVTDVKVSGNMKEVKQRIIERFKILRTGSTD